MNAKSPINNMTEGSLLHCLLSFSFPLMLCTLMQMAYTMADMLFVGWYVGDAGLSAISIGGEIIHLCTAVCSGLSNACQVLVSQYIGSGNQRGVGRVVGSMFTIVCIASLLMGGTTWLFCTPILRLLNTPEASFTYAADYVRTCSAGILFIFAYNYASAVLRGMGNSSRPLLYITISALSNIVLDYLLVGRLSMGVRGAALATVISQGLSFILSASYLYRSRASFNFSLAKLRLSGDKAMLRRLLGLGIPMAMQVCAVLIASLVLTAVTNSYGVVVSAITGLGNKISSIVSIVTTGLAQAGTAIVGQNYGACKLDRVHQTIRLVFIGGLVFALPLALIVMLFPETIFGLFDSSEELLQLSHSYAPIAALTLLAYAFRGPCVSFVNGIGFAKLNLIIGVLESLIFRIGLVLLLGRVFGLGLMGYWIGSGIASFSYPIVSFPYYKLAKWEPVQSNN